ncbi:hypothetical protein ACNTMW_04350 [Planosporangium sp. 12N6]|uniref:hypothetical protein n=1 Tax=Planosporangium spinosum TaxID=3402278 RepID=UPI003CF7DA46
MTSSSPLDVVAALRDFVERIDALDRSGGIADPAGGADTTIEVRSGDDRARLAITASVARALVEALRGYHDPRDRGACDHCGGRRLDDNLLCLDCQRPNGLFGQLVMERAARYGGDPAAIPGRPPAEPGGA